MSIQSLWNLAAYFVRQLVRHYCADMRRRAVVGLARLLAAMAYTAVSIAIAIMGMIFATIGVVCLLKTVMASHWTYLIVAGFYGVLLMVLRLLRQHIIKRSVARHISRLLSDE